MKKRNQRLIGESENMAGTKKKGGTKEKAAANAKSTGMGLKGKGAKTRAATGT
jgi:hypothetical protein